MSIKNISGLRGDIDEKENAQNVVDEFVIRHNEYYLDTIEDEDLIEDTTQAYWQSMKLSKQRMMQNDVTMKVEYKRTNENRGFLGLGLSALFLRGGCLGAIFALVFHKISRLNLLYAQNDDDNDNSFKKRTGNKATVYGVEENMLAKRIFYKNGRKIYTDKDREICQTDFLQSAIQGENVTCPNCGNVAKVSTYIDGCDYCNAKFTVKELEEKVSGFSFREDLASKLRRFITSMNIFGLIVADLIPFLIIILAIIIVIWQTEYKHLKLRLFGLMSFMALFPMTITLGIAVVITLVSNVIFYYKMKRTIGTRINFGEDVKNIPSKYFCQDFLQNTEWKLKSILMADNMDDVKSFAKCDVSEIISTSKDVIDSSITRLNIDNIKNYGNYSELTGEVIMRTYRHANNRIKKVSEKFSFTATCKKEVEEQPVTAIRQYVCTGCGSSVDVLNGAICGYCNAVLDYENIGWVITDLKYDGKKKSEYPKMAFRILGSHILAFVITYVLSLSWVFASEMSDPGEKVFYTMLLDRTFINGCFEMLDEKDKLDEVLPVYVEQADFEQGFYDRRFEYALKNDAVMNTKEIVELYRKYLEGEGYNVIQEESILNGDDLALYIPVKYEGNEYSLSCVIKRKNKSIIVYECLDKLPY